MARLRYVEIYVSIDFEAMLTRVIIQFWFAGTKVIMMTGLLILSFILFWGGGPDHDRYVIPGQNVALRHAKDCKYHGDLIRTTYL